MKSLGWLWFDHDAWGDPAKAVGANSKSGAQFTFKGGLDLIPGTRYLTKDETTKKKIIDELLSRGIDNVMGVDLDTFIVVYNQ
jgi:hypothetical protein